VLGQVSVLHSMNGLKILASTVCSSSGASLERCKEDRASRIENHHRLHDNAVSHCGGGSIEHLLHPWPGGFGSLDEAAVECQHLEPGDDFGGDRGEDCTHLVDLRTLAGREPAQLAVFDGLDAVLNPGAGAPPGSAYSRIGGPGNAAS
jgi:hypothetical protein